eukprot:COSAG06_NODE_515_length_14818_cov_1329.391263_5_plen_128_part_00
MRDTLQLSPVAFISQYIREEVSFLFGYCWSVLRPMAHELGQRFVEDGYLQSADAIFYLYTPEIQQAIDARATAGSAGGGAARLSELGVVAEKRRALREAYKQHHPPGTIPSEASENPGVKFKEVMIE